MTKQEIVKVIECINLLKISGENTKNQVREKLIEMLPGYEEK
jgi:hypothetical protein